MEARTTRPRIEDVARAAGVSKTAVSFAFNSPERLAAETATRIREVAEELGYRPHPVARMLTQRHTMTIGVVTPQPLAVMFSNPFFASFGEGIAEAVEAAGYGLHLISPLDGSLALAVDRSTVDGVVAVGLSAEHPEVGQIRRAGVPIVLVDADDLPEHPSVVVDDEAGARAAAEHLLALGHRDILVIAVEGPASSSGRPTARGVTGRRLGGYRAAFDAVGAPLPADWIVQAPASIEGGRAAFAAAWSRGLRPTAVLAMSDATAVGVMRAARDLRLDLPADLSVVGFDDVDLAAHVDPPLTTVHQPIRTKAAEAIRLLLAAIDAPRSSQPEHVRLGTSLVVRRSTGPAPIVPPSAAPHATRLPSRMPDVPGWVRDAVFYQVFPDRFASSARVAKPGPLEPWDAAPTNHGFKGGDLLGIVEHLDHIGELGATALYLTPVFQSASNHRYHTYDYFTVDPMLGGNAALRELVDAAHGRGMRVILDGVFNHTGRGFWPFHHVLETGAGSPYRSWFTFDEAGLAAGRPLDPYPDGVLRTGGVAAPENLPARERLGYDAWWGIPALPKLNVAEPAVREYLWSVAEHWLRFGIDGWRLDVPGEIDDRPFWVEFRRRCRAVNPEAYLVGEIWDVAPDWLSGDRFDATMNYPLAKAIIGFVAGGSLDEDLLARHHEYGQIRRLDGAGFAARLGELLTVYAPETTAAQLNLLDSHDTPRVLSVFAGDREALELATLLQATLPGAPCIFAGDEVGVAGGIDPDSRRAFPWDPARWDRALYDAMRAVIAARHAEPALRSDEVTLTGVAGPAVAFRRGPGGALAVVVNAGEDAMAVGLGAGTAGQQVLAVGRDRSIEVRATDGGDALEAIVPPRTGGIIRVTP